VSLAQTSRSLVKNAKTRFVGAADADIQQFVLLQMSVALDNPGRSVKDEDLVKPTEVAFEKAVQNGETWAVSLKNSYRDNVIKPLVEKARLAGVDPFPVVKVAETSLSEDDVRSMIAELDAAETADDLMEVEIEDDDESDTDGSDERSVSYGSAATTAA
jgi:hypothetical protein